MKTVHSLAAGALVACALGAGSFARAEVVAETDPTGRYVRTIVFANASVKNLRIWGATRAKIGFWPLNLSGDVSGDLWPVVAENPVQQRWPWTVWSHFNGNDFDLVWSRWLGPGWSPIAQVEPDPGLDDAVDPFVTFSASGRPHMVWLRGNGGESGTARVVFSMFLSSRWMLPLEISEPAEDAVHPTVAVRADGSIEVAYDTPSGHVTRIVRLASPTTITDDFTPFNTATVSAPTLEPY